MSARDLFEGSTIPQYLFPSNLGAPGSFLTVGTGGPVLTWSPGSGNLQPVLTAAPVFVSSDPANTGSITINCTVYQSNNLICISLYNSAGNIRVQSGSPRTVVLTAPSPVFANYFPAQKQELQGAIFDQPLSANAWFVPTTIELTTDGNVTITTNDQVAGDDTLTFIPFTCYFSLN